MEEQKKTTKAPLVIIGCVVALVVGVMVCCVGACIVSYALFQQRARHAEHVLTDFNIFHPPHTGNYHSISTTAMLGEYELADADAVKEFNSRVKKWFVERGFTELEDMPLRSIQRLPQARGGNRTSWSSQGDWDKPGVLLLLKFDDHNSLYILVPDCYHRETHVQMIGYRSDFVGSADHTRPFEIQLDKLKDDFERAFPSGNYRGGLPESMGIP